MTALAHGAAHVEAFAEPDEARARAATLGHAALTCGERDNHRIAGFDLGNSPLEYTREAVAGKILCSTTTNGTQALRAAAGAERVLVASFLNLVPTAAVIARDAPREVHLVCAGSSGREALEDSACAGAIIEWLLAADRLSRRTLHVSAEQALAAWERCGRTAAGVMAAAPHANALRGAGYEKDLAFASQTNHYAVVVETDGPRIRVVSEAPPVTGRT